jgi:hypothetical protein
MLTTSIGDTTMSCIAIRGRHEQNGSSLRQTVILLTPNHNGPHP